MTPEQTKLLEDLRSGAVLAAESAPAGWRWPHPLWPKFHWQFSNEDPGDIRDKEPVYAASPDPTPALVEMIEGLVRERDEAREMRKRLDKRIHCQRKANRDNWEIVEKRRNYLGSRASQRMYVLMRDRALAAEAELDALREALAWYGEQARLARLIHREGDAGRNALAADGGKRARALTNETNDVGE